MRAYIHREDIEAARCGVARSSRWPRIEKLHLTLQPKCACYGDKMDPHSAMQVHHIFPFHYCIALGRPDLELDLRNLITLCENEPGQPGENHHLLVGHLDSFQSSNLDVVAAARTMFHGMSGKDIRASKQWQALVAGRLKRLQDMSEREKNEFAQLMNQRLPRRW